MAFGLSSTIYHALTLSCLYHRDTRIYLVWAPKDEELEGDQPAHTLASKVCWGFPPDGMDPIHSAAYQKDWACTQAFCNWEREYFMECMLANFGAKGVSILVGAAYYTHYQPTHLCETSPSVESSSQHGKRWVWLKDQTPPLPPPLHYIHCSKTSCGSHLHWILCPMLLPSRPSQNIGLPMWYPSLHPCYILEERSAWLELGDYDFDTAHVVLEACTSDTLWEQRVCGHRDGTGLRGRGRYPRCMRCSKGIHMFHVTRLDWHKNSDLGSKSATGTS